MAMNSLSTLSVNPGMNNKKRQRANSQSTLPNSNAIELTNDIFVNFFRPTNISNRH